MTRIRTDDTGHAHWTELTNAEQGIVLTYLPCDDPTVTESGDSIVPAAGGAMGQPSAPGLIRCGCRARRADPPEAHHLYATLGDGVVSTSMTKTLSRPT